MPCLTAATDSIFARSNASEIHSWVDLRSDFQGIWVDDVASAMFCAKDLSEVLVLGVSLGSCLLPMSTFPSMRHAILVDTDPIESPVFKTISERQITVEHIHDDAYEFTHKSKRRFGFIYVDLYDLKSHSPLTCSPAFARSLMNVLESGGLVAINCFDIPAYLFPERPITITTAIMQTFAAVFPYVFFLKDRRNCIVVASTSDLRFAPHETVGRTEADQIALAISQWRSRCWSRWVNSSPFESSRRPQLGTFVEIDAQMSARARKLKKVLEVHIPALGEFDTFSRFALECELKHLTNILRRSTFLRSLLLCEIAACCFQNIDLAMKRFRALIEATGRDWFQHDALSSVGIAQIRCIAVRASCDHRWFCELLEIPA
ncbi:spermidine synthase [Bradyrhizobium sp. AZCC 1699]|uniref:spermidine synthase n=1 Tax=Bradyrhizobium sp. AZCC 1699 TaxID=3117024 RepID=UPI002FF1AC76